MSKPTATEIDAVLPQTQCGDCGYGGCMPYAKAMANSEADIDLCPPGGMRVLQKLANLFKKNITNYHIETKPQTVAVIDEAACIGCTKCIQACPVDAISGAAKLMHTVIEDECTGCNLCVEPCPMDCITMQPITEVYSEVVLQQRADHARERYLFRNQRLAKNKITKRQSHQKAKLIKTQSPDAKKQAILAAVNRAKQKRNLHES